MNLTEISRSVLGANRGACNNAYAKLNPQNPKSREEREAKLREIFAYENGPKVSGYDKLQTEIIDLYIQANGFWFDFFEYRTIAGAEVPKYYTEVVTPDIPINIISNLGGVSTITYSDGINPVYFDMNMYQSDAVKYAKYDLAQGFVDKSDKINKKLQTSVEKKLETMAEASIGTCFGTFDSNVWVLDSRIKNPPTTNDLDLSATCQGKVTKDLLKAVVQHGDRMEKKIRALYLPGARRSDIFDWVSVSGSDIGALGTIPAAIQEEIWRTGNVSGALVPPISFTNRLEGEVAGSIYAYAVFDGPVGYFYQKPEIHQTVTKDDFLYSETRTLFTGAFIIPAYLKPNIVRIKIG